MVVAIMQGRTNYENMLSMTISIKLFVFTSLDASGCESCPKRLFSSLDVKIDSLHGV